MKLSKSAAAVFAVALALAAPVSALADTIRLRDGTVVRGQIIAYKDQQFTVLIGSGQRGRRSRMTIYMEDVESIEFDNPFGADGGAAGARGDEATYDADDSSARPSSQPQRTTQPPAASRPAPQPQQQPQRASGPVFFPINVRVDPRSTESGWVSSGFTVRRGQRVRVTATGRVTLSNGQATTPTGLPRVADADKLLANEATGALVAVIGDDNNDFILVSSGREFTAQRDGIIFLTINTGRLTATSGAFDVVIEPEAVSSR
ncbi:MAG TPA: hypothetical protein VK421_04890 [Pyrinomonadaceae bacterium]|nr:hypothetical protein [Pyrinomonadaceae bacterium]